MNWREHIIDSRILNYSKRKKYFSAHVSIIKQSTSGYEVRGCVYDEHPMGFQNKMFEKKEFRANIIDAKIFCNELKKFIDKIYFKER